MHGQACMVNWEMVQLPGLWGLRTYRRSRVRVHIASEEVTHFVLTQFRQPVGVALGNKACGPGFPDIACKPAWKGEVGD